jgi:HAMP domain-containing protein
MKIRTRLMLVLSTLVVLVVLVSLTAVTAFGQLGGTVARAMNENVRSIDACAAMNEALDRTDRGFLLALSGQIEYGREAVQNGADLFDESVAAAGANVTLADEQERIDHVREAWTQYRQATRRFEASLFEPPPPSASSPPATLPVAAAAAAPAPADGAAVVDPGLPLPGPPAVPVGLPAAVGPRVPVGASSVATVADYVVLAEPHLVELRDAVRDLSDLNHVGMQNQATAADKSGWRRTAWVVAVGVLGLALAVFLGRRLYLAITFPLEAIGRGIAALGRGDLSRRVAYHSADELGQIALAVNAMAERLAESAGSREGKLRAYERLAWAVLDATEPAGLVLDREGRVLIAGRQVRERLGDDPLEALRQGAGGLLPAGEIDHRLQEVLGLRPSQLPEAERGPSGGVVVSPVLGRAGTVLGALVRVHGAAAAPPGRPGVR